jgi:hypothetical protein
VPPELTRRALLRATGGLGVAALPLSRESSASASVPLPALARAPWVAAENARAGTRAWTIGRPAPAGELEAFASATSAPLGSTIDLMISAPAPAVSLQVYRLGYYGGLGARLVEVRHRVPTDFQAVPTPDALGTIDCDWTTSATLELDARYLPGQYLARLQGADGSFRWVPFLVRDDASSAAYYYLSAVTTWQAYNTWGGYSLYRHTDPTGTVAISSERAVRVSFNRPYQARFANGSADLIGNELPLLMLAEGLGLDLAYGTDIDLHERGADLARHRALLSLGHDEYWSPPMRDALLAALAAGTNAAFFGANFCYRKIRFDPDYANRDRLMVNYRSTADPLSATDPGAATVNWADWPSDQPSSAFSGSSYGGVDGVGSLRVLGADGWLWHGTGLRPGAVLPGALADEFNNYDAVQPSPGPVQLFGHSRVAGGVSDVTYVARPGSAGVFASGTGHWVNALTDAPRLSRHLRPPVPHVTPVLRRATQNVLALFGSGPAGSISPSR